MQNSKIKVGIIGAGQVGSILAEQLNLNQQLSFIVSRNKNKSPYLIDKGISNKTILRSVLDINNHVDFIIIAVRDSQIHQVVNELVQIDKSFLRKTIVLHTSGSLNKEELSKLQDFKAIICSAHPYQTFFKQDIKILENIAWGIDCEEDNFEQISELIYSLKGKPIKLSGAALSNKPMYHLSAVAASNFTVALIALAKDLVNKLDLDANTFLKPIINQTVNNSYEYLNKDEIPLTGPIARADYSIIEKHINSLQEFPEIEKSYKDISKFVLDMAYSKSILSESDFMKINNLLHK